MSAHLPASAQAAATVPAADVIGVLLAAGHASRFGRDKRRLPWPGGPTLLQAALRPLLHTCGRTLLVIAPGDTWGQAVARQHGAGVVWSFARSQGLAASLCAAMPHVQGSAAMVVALADMGDVKAASIAALIARWRQHPGQPALPTCKGQPGNPRLIPAACYPLLRHLQGDDGVRRALNWAQASRVPVPDAGVLRDVDSPADVPPGLSADWPPDCFVFDSLRNPLY